MSERPIVAETRNLTKIYGDGAEVRALDGVSLTVRAGEFVAIVGPSGSGKSTLLNLIGALDRSTSGDIIINGTSLSEVRDVDGFRSRTVGFVFQMHNLIPTLTARENVEVPMYETESNATKRRARAAELLLMVGLADRADALPNQMSGGERQRVAIARALANRPAIVLADEPTGNLDSKTTADILDLMSELNRAGTTIIVVTHNPQVSRATKRVITIRDGKIASDVSLEDAFQAYATDLKNSALGHAILEGEDIPGEFRDIAPRLKALLEQV